jgi:hypothetical protein
MHKATAAAVHPRNRGQKPQRRLPSSVRRLISDAQMDELWRGIIGAQQHTSGAMPTSLPHGVRPGRPRAPKGTHHGQ